MPEKDKQDTIYVNGQPHTWPKHEQIGYLDVVKFGYPNYNPQNSYTVKYRKGHGEKPEGILAPGESVKVKDGMQFNVRDTGQS
jgi:hypothetical protein